MLARVAVIALNQYREAVRARILHGLFGLALATTAYSLVVGAYTAKNQLRVVSDLGAASISLYAIVVAVVLGATSLHRELELKTLFPILARPISRSEYLFGKFLGTLLLLAVFVAANAGVVLLSLAVLVGEPATKAVALGAGSAVALFALGFKVRRWLTYLPIAWAVIVVGAGAWLTALAPDDRRVVLGLATLTVLEVGVVAAIATLFSAFSSPFLTAVFTFSVFLVGRSADTLARLPARVFGEAIHRAGELLSRVVPNLMVYVPPRPVLTGETPDVQLSQYLASASLHALGWTMLLLAAASVIFRRRDFL